MIHPRAQQLWEDLWEGAAQQRQAAQGEEDLPGVHYTPSHMLSEY